MSNARPGSANPRRRACDTPLADVVDRRCGRDFDGRLCGGAEFVGAAGDRDRRAATAQDICPKPNPGMDPDQLLREFLKATADPANRHLAARQFLTESASSAWDDQGSALLIDKVVFVETRTVERVSVTMKPTSSVRCRISGCSRPPTASCPTLARSR